MNLNISSSMPIDELILVLNTQIVLMKQSNEFFDILIIRGI